MSRVVQIPACTAGGVHIRAVVLSDDRAAGGGLALNAEFLRFAAHWGFLPRSCRPYRARTKGKVERPIRCIRESFFYGRSFANDNDLNEQAVRWLEGTANVRRHATTGERPIDRFERDERAVLLPLATCPYRRPGVRQAPDLAPRLLPACLEGYQAQYLRVPRLLTDLRIAHGEGTIPKLYRDLARIEVLILDDWGLAPIDGTRPPRDPR